MYFDAARRAKSIRDAARRLNVASSAVNRQILQLEAEIGAKLFDRFPTGLRLTATGEVLARHVINVIEDGERLKSELDALQGMQCGRVELLTLDGLCHDIVPTAIEFMHRSHPRITVSVGVSQASEIPAAINAGDAHLGLTFEAKKQQGLRQIASVSLRLGLAVISSSKFARLDAVELRDCRDVPLIVPKSNLANHDQILPLLRHLDLQSRSTFESGSIEMMKQLVLRGLGGACMTRLGLEREINKGRIVHVPFLIGGKEIRSELGLYARSESTMSVATSAFAHELTGLLARIASEEHDTAPISLDPMVRDHVACCQSDSSPCAKLI